MIDLTAINILCLDPGITTGYALGVIDDGLLRISTGQQRWDEKGLYNTLHKVSPDIVIYERFEARGTIQGVELFSRNLIGVINLYGQLNPSVKVYAQMPQDAIGGYYSNDVLRKNSLYKSTTGGHANDACRHLLVWWTFKSGYQFNKKGFEPA